MLIDRRAFLKVGAFTAVRPRAALGAVVETEDQAAWRRIANPQWSWPVNAEIQADWEEGWRIREASDGQVKLAVVVRPELLASGSRGEPDLDGLGPWNARMPRGEFKKRWEVWKDRYQLLFNLEWTKDPRLVQVPQWLGYWNVARLRGYVQLQSFVMDVAHPDYQAFIVPRLIRVFEASRADAIHVGVKWDRFELPTVHLSVPAGVLDVRTQEVKAANDFPDVVTVTATPGFSDGMRAILRQAGLPFLTALQLLPEFPKMTFTMPEYEAACLAWIGDLEPLWLGRLT